VPAEQQGWSGVSLIFDNPVVARVASQISAERVRATAGFAWPKERLVDRRLTEDMFVLVDRRYGSLLESIGGPVPFRRLWSSVDLA
jgi:hypothetical protein